LGREEIVREGGKICARAESGDFQSTPGRLQNEAHVNAEPRQHVNQRVRAEEVQATAQQITHAGLRDGQDRGGLGLRQVPRANRFLKLDQQIGSDPTDAPIPRSRTRDRERHCRWTA